MLLYGHRIMTCAFDDDRTIVVAMVDGVCLLAYTFPYAYHVMTFIDFLEQGVSHMAR